ncbi:MAG: ParB N-terminal domain-containing protein [Pseudomonadota bacterium]
MEGKSGSAIWRQAMNEPIIETLPIGLLKPWKANARTHSNQQVRQIADSITQFGFTNPVLIDDANSIWTCHGFVPCP